MNKYVAYVIGIKGDNDPGYSVGYGVGRDFAVRPVISLKSDVLWSNGDGSATNPYEIVLN